VQPAGIKVQTATTADIGPLAGTLARAFADDPVMNYLVGPDLRRLGTFFAAEVRQYLRTGEVLAAGDNGAGALWAKPNQWRTGWADILRSAPAMTRALRTNLPRALKVLNRMEKAHPREPHWYLGVIGTDPASQGKGLGGALIDPILARCDEAGLGAYLESSKERNISYYNRFGFTMTGEITFPDGPTLWPMWREPRT
jgi:GNAT superfamily N-acetyltransferase